MTCSPASARPGYPAQLALLAIVLLVGAGLLTPLAHAQDLDSAAAVVRTHWGPPGDERSVSPGDDGVTLTVVLENEQAQTYHFLRAELGETDGLWPTHDESDVDTFQGPFKQGDTWKARFTVDVNETVERDATLTVPISIRLYTDKNNLTDANRRNVFHNLRVPILGSPSLVVDATPSRLPAASSVPVSLHLTNHGDGGASDVEVTAVPASGSTLVLASGSHTTLNRTYLGPGSQATVPLRVLTPTAGGTQSLSVTLTYTNTAGTQVTQARSVGFVIQPMTAPPLAVQLTDVQLATDRPGTLALDVTSQSDRRLANVTLDIGLPGPNPATGQPPIVPTAPTTVRAGDLGPGQAASVQVPVLVSETASGTHQLTVTATWEEPDGLVRSWTFPLGVRVDGAIELSLLDMCAAMDPEGPRLVAGGFVVNTGDAPAHNLVVRIVGDGQIQASAPEVLDDVAPNAPRSFTVETRVDERSQDGNPGQVSLRLSWTDDDGDPDEMTVTTRITDARQLPADALCEDELDDASEDGTSQVPGPSAGWLVLLLAAVAVARVWRSRW